MLEYEYIKLSILAFMYLLLFLYEQYRPYFENRNKHFQHTARNLILASINAVISSLCLIYLIKHTARWATENNFGILNQLNLTAISATIVAILLIDLWQYIWHRANHIIPILWRFHQVHHSDKDMDASTGLRFHPVEIIISSISRIAVIPILGVEIEHLIIYELISLPIILFHHSNIKINNRIDGLLRMIIVTPHIHRLHHSDIQHETDSNYSTIFSFWDRLLRTYTMRPIEKQFNLGLGNKFDIQEWNSFRGIVNIPFRKKT